MLCEAHGYWAVAHLIQINRGTSPIVSIVCWAVVHLFQINRGLSPIVLVPYCFVGQNSMHISKLGGSVLDAI